MKKTIKGILAVLICLTLVLPLSAASAIAAEPTDSSKKIIVYFPNWGTYNAKHRNMAVGMIPWDKVTVINHAFFEVDSSYKLASTDKDADFEKIFEHSEGWNPGDLRGHMGEYKYFKKQNPNVNVLISVGGWTRGQNFHAMAQSPSTRAVFVQSVVDFLKQYPFIDGIDLDWEYPGIDRTPDPNDEYDKGCPGGPEDKENFTALLKEIREAYNSNGMIGKLLTIAAPAGYDKLELQEPDKYAQYLDWLNVMTYDIHGAWEKTTNHHSAIYANPDDPSGTSPIDIKNKYNTDYAMKNLKDKYGIPASKLNVGSPYYSRGWKNVSGGTNGMFANADGAPVGSWDNPRSPGGQYPYFELKQMENANGYVKYRDDSYAKTPWLYNASLGVTLTYEDEISLGARCDYINSNGFGGLIVWEISGDDVNNTMTKLAYDKLIKGTDITTVEAPVFSPTGGTYTTAQDVKITCATDGARIRYTTDGSEPNAASAEYSSAISVSKTMTLKAKAFKAGLTDSVAAIAAYVISGNTSSEWKTNTAYKAGDLVTYQGKGYECRQPHTSLPGWEPPAVPALWLLHEGDIDVEETVATPVFSPAGGTYATPQNVTISCTTDGAVIRYTTDGSEPTSTSKDYKDIIAVLSTTMIKAKAFKSGMKDSATASATFKISANPPSDMPAHILTGYWQNFDNGAKCLKISDVPAAYNIIAVAFAEATGVPGQVTFKLDSTLSSRLDGYTESAFIADIAAAKARGQKVIISVGGERGAVSVADEASAANFADSVYTLMTQYGFDGVDIDLENGINAAYMTSALRQLSSKAGSGLIITMAPQTIDMQSTGMGYFQVALNIKDILTVVNMQYYNSGTMLGQDGKVYAQGTPDFLSALAAIQLENGLRPDQVGLGLPASSSGAGGGYMDPSQVNVALEGLAKGTSTGTYTPPKAYPGIRGAMTWSINWDASNGYQFANTVRSKLDALE